MHRLRRGGGPPRYPFALYYIDHSDVLSFIKRKKAIYVLKPAKILMRFY